MGNDQRGQFEPLLQELSYYNEVKLKLISVFRPIVEKFTYRLTEIDELTGKPRYGTTMQKKVKGLVDLYNDMCEKLIPDQLDPVMDKVESFKKKIEAENAQKVLDLEKEKIMEKERLETEAEIE